LIKVRYSSLRHSFFTISFNQISQNWALLNVFVITFSDVHKVSFVQMMVFYEAFKFLDLLLVIVIGLIIIVDYEVFKTVIYLNEGQQYFSQQFFFRRSHDVVVQKVKVRCSSWIRSSFMISCH